MGFQISHISDFLGKVLGFELRSSYLYNKHFYQLYHLPSLSISPSLPPPSLYVCGEGVFANATTSKMRIHVRQEENPRFNTIQYLVLVQTSRVWHQEVYFRLFKHGTIWGGGEFPV